MVQPLLDSRVPYGRLQHPLTIYPIDQMKSLHLENDYIDTPRCDLTTATEPQGKHEGAGSPAGSPTPSSSVPLRGPRCHHTSVDFVQRSAQLHQ